MVIYYILIPDKSCGMYAQTVHTIEPNGTSEATNVANDSIAEGAGTTLPGRGHDEIDEDDIFSKRRYTHLQVKMLLSIVPRKSGHIMFCSTVYELTVQLYSSGKWNLVVSTSAQWLSQSGNLVLWFKL